MSSKTTPRTTRRSTRSPQPLSASKASGPTPKSAAKGSRRPPLPTKFANSMLSSHRGRLHSVKTQELKLLDGAAPPILIARVKIPTPKGISGHLIRRMDTDAISASSLFRVAFPNSSQQDEDDEMEYLRTLYDTVRAGAEDRGQESRLTGVWIPTADAPAVVDAYGLSKFAADLIAFENPFVPPNQDTEPEHIIPTAPPPAVAAAPPAAGTRSAKKAASPAPEPTRSSKRARMTSPCLATLADAKGVDLSSTLAHAISTSGKEAEATKEVPDSLMVSVTSVSHDPTTGDAVETTLTTTLVGTDEQVAAAREEARELVANLKDAAPAAKTSEVSKKRALEDQGSVAGGTRSSNNKGVLGRLWWRRREAAKAAISQASSDVAEAPRGVVLSPTDRIAPSTRRNIAVVGLVVAGAAASIAPYFF